MSGARTVTLMVRTARCWAYKVIKRQSCCLGVRYMVRERVCKLKIKANTGVSREGRT